MSLTPPLVPETLREYGAATQAAVREYLPAGQPGYLYDLLADYPGRSGKMMRSSLCIAHARLFGARLEDALASAAAIELLHNALLIHDDVEDDSETRRGRPTLHQLHGVPLAINAGDALLLAALRPLLDNVDRIGARRALRILEETQRVAWESAEGQAMELGWRRDNRNDLTDADYLTMVLKKTAWLSVIFPALVGVIIAAPAGTPLGAAKLATLGRFGFFLGAAFQIQDDLLNLTADARYGKERNGDLFEAKRTLMLLHAYRNATADDRRRLDALLARPRARRSAAQVAWMRALLERHGSVDYARGIAHGLAGAALHEFDRVYGGLPDSRDKEFIRGLATWVFERS